MNTMWLLGSLGLGAGLMALLDPAQGASRREAVRDHARDFGSQTRGRWGDTRRSLGRQAQAVRAMSRLPFNPMPGPGERLRTQVQGLPFGLCLLGSVGLGVGLGYLLAPQGGGRLRETLQAYWHPTAPHAPSRQARHRAWRIFQGQDTYHVDAHTRKPARDQAWYAEPGGYDSPVLYSPPFATWDEAATWARAQDAQ